MTKAPIRGGEALPQTPNHYVREWRLFMGWSQEELAEMVDVHQSKIARIERGDRELKTSFLKALARVFRVPASALLEVNPDTPQGAQTAEWLLVWHRLTPSQRAELLKMANAIVIPGDKPDGA